MDKTIRNIARVVTVATSVLVAVVELKKAVDGFQKELKARKEERDAEPNPKQRDKYAT